MNELAINVRNEGDNEPCYYCKQLCQGTAGDPNLWPIPLTHPDEPGVVKWHHIGCVSIRLKNNSVTELLDALAFYADPKSYQYAYMSHQFVINDGGDLARIALKKFTKPEPLLDFVQALKIAEGVLEQYRMDQPKWWKKMDGTPILNDVAVRMAEAFRDAFNERKISVVKE